MEAPGEQDKHGQIDRRTVLRGGVVSAIALGAAACAPAGPEGQATPAGSHPPAATHGAALTTQSTAGAPTAGAAASAAAAGAPKGPALLHTAGPDIRNGPRDRPAVALTFHGAGDPSLTRAALATLAAHGARVTVFAVGQWLAGHPDLGRAIVTAGHDLGNHTWSHQTMPRLGASTARAEVAKGAAIVATIPGSSPLLFRPSGTPTSTPRIRAAAAAAGYARCISYDVDPADYQDPGAALVVSRTLSSVRAGSIVSLHLGHAGTIAALPDILRGLRQRSLRAVTMRELLS